MYATNKFGFKMRGENVTVNLSNGDSSLTVQFYERQPQSIGGIPMCDNFAIYDTALSIYSKVDKLSALKHSPYFNIEGG